MSRLISLTHEARFVPALRCFRCDTRTTRSQTCTRQRVSACHRGQSVLQWCRKVVPRLSSPGVTGVTWWCYLVPLGALGQGAGCAGRSPVSPLRSRRSSRFSEHYLWTCTRVLEVSTMLHWNILVVFAIVTITLQVRNTSSITSTTATLCIIFFF